MPISALIAAAFMMVVEPAATPASPPETISARAAETQDQFRRRAAEWVINASGYGPWSEDAKVDSIVFFRWDRGQETQDSRGFDLTFRLSDRRCASVDLKYRPAEDRFEKGGIITWDCYKFFPKMGGAIKPMPRVRARAALGG